MSKRDYTKYHNDPKPKANAAPAEVEEVVEQKVNTAPEVEVEAQTPDPAAVPMVEEAKPIVGIVANCERLNVRKSPSPTAEIICVIECGAKLSIDEAESTETFYKICAEIGAEGYCMKRFIQIEE